MKIYRYAYLADTDDEDAVTSDYAREFWIAKLAPSYESSQRRIAELEGALLRAVADFELAHGGRDTLTLRQARAVLQFKEAGR